MLPWQPIKLSDDDESRMNRGGQLNTFLYKHFTYILNDLAGVLVSICVPPIIIDSKFQHKCCCFVTDNC